MFSSHLIKVIVAFCGMIVFGLASLVIIDSFKDKEEDQVASPVVAEPVVLPKTEVKIPTKTPAKKTTPQTQATPR